MVLLNHSSPAYTELSYAIEKGLPAHGSSDAEDKLMDLGAAMQKATCRPLRSPESLAGRKVKGSHRNT